jgi:hypothetical protein
LPEQLIEAHERGEEPLTLEQIKKYAQLYKVFTYELFRSPTRRGGEDAWNEEEGHYRLDLSEEIPDYTAASRSPR